jgi:hypothetical protein
MNYMPKSLIVLLHIPSYQRGIATIMQFISKLRPHIKGICRRSLTHGAPALSLFAAPEVSDVVAAEEVSAGEGLAQLVLKPI